MSKNKSSEAATRTESVPYLGLRIHVCQAQSMSNQVIPLSLFFFCESSIFLSDSTSSQSKRNGGSGEEEEKKNILDEILSTINFWFVDD